MTDNQVVSTMFNISKSIRMVRIVSFGNWNEEPKWLGIHLNMCLYLGCDGVDLSHFMDPHYMSASYAQV